MRVFLFSILFGMINTANAVVIIDIYGRVIAEPKVVVVSSRETGVAYLEGLGYNRGSEPSIGFMNAIAFRNQPSKVLRGAKGGVSLEEKISVRQYQAFLNEERIPTNRVIVVGHYAGEMNPTSVFVSTKPEVNFELAASHVRLDGEEFASNFSKRLENNTLVDVVACSSCDFAGNLASKVREAGLSDVQIRSSKRFVNVDASDNSLVYTRFTGDKPVKVSADDFLNDGVITFKGEPSTQRISDIIEAHTVKDGKIESLSTEDVVKLKKPAKVCS